MAAHKGGGKNQPQQVRKSLTVDAAKLGKAKELLGASSDAEALRMALDHFLSHFEGHHGEEE
jgi:hypothetical protein